MQMTILFESFFGIKLLYDYRKRVCIWQDTWNKECEMESQTGKTEDKSNPEERMIVSITHDNLSERNNSLSHNFIIVTGQNE